MRQEKKYLLRSIELPSFEKKILKLGFRIKHLPNVVNNIYFDDRNFTSAMENIEGDQIRSKYRIRWYDEKNVYTLEKKIKYSSSGDKVITNLNSMTLIEAIKEVKSILPDYEPVVQNQYRRNYYELDSFRITIDSRLVFSRPFSDRIIFSDKNVVEIKYDTEIDHLFKEVFSFLPQLTKFSKYLEGLNSI